MYRVVVLPLFVVVALAAIEDDRIEKCYKINASLMRCCTSTHISPYMLFLSEINECYSKPGPVLSCDPEECLAKKLGYYGDDGKLDTEKFIRFLEKKFENDQLLMDAIKGNCLNIDISGLSPPMCDFLVMNFCVYHHFKDYCTAWSNEGECQGVKELVEMC